MAKSKGKDDKKIETGDISQTIVGDNNIQELNIGNITTKNVEISKAEMDALHKMFESFKEQIVKEAPSEKQAKALEKADELKEAVTEKKPDLTTMEYVKNWFTKNIPQLAGAVTGLVVNPIVGKLVEAAGETVAQEFKRRFGGS